MFSKGLSRYPVLIMGIIMFSLFVFNEETAKWWKSYTYRYIPNTCTSLEKRLKETLPAHWSIECPGTEHLILIVQDSKRVMDTQKRRVYLYKLLANTYVQFAKMANLETAEYLLKLKVVIKSPYLEIVSQTNGKDFVRFASLKTPRSISLHLKNTVKVKETAL